MVKGPQRFNVSQAAYYLDVSRQTVRRWRESGLLPRRATWTQAELDAAAEAKPPKTQTPRRRVSPCGASSEPATVERPGESTGSQDAATPAEAPPAPSATSEGTARDPLELTLPMPTQGGGADDGRTRRAGEAQADDPGEAPAEAPPCPAPPTLFGRWRRHA